MSARFAILSDAGRMRERNEDAAVALPELGLYAVADGMGGHAGGEIASRIAIDTFVREFAARERPRRVRDETDRMRAATLEANEAVLRSSFENGLFGMGTTLTAALVRGRTLCVAHVGDSRAYFVRDGELRQLTRDHTIVELLVREGMVAADAASDHPERHVLVQAIGGHEPIDPQVELWRIPPDTRVLLTSDGIHDVVDPALIAELASRADLEGAVHALVDGANARGGPDNATVILLEP